MTGGDFDRKPLHYEKLQFLVNSLHTNQQAENADDIRQAQELVYRIEAVNEPQSILVVGCRTGYELTTLKEAFPDAIIWGVDIVSDFIEIAKQRGNARIADMHELPFPDNHFEWVVCAGTLEHAYNVKLAASELLLYVTADLDEPSSRNVSTFAFSKDPEEWLALFPGTKILYQRVDEKGVYFTLEKKPCE